MIFARAAVSSVWIFSFTAEKNFNSCPRGFDFLEVQDDYKSHFDINKDRLESLDTKIQYLSQNYVEPIPTQYDLILCNPPYFNPSEGLLSPNRFKNRCRFFIDASHAELIATIESALRHKGRAYVLTRNAKPPTTAKLNAQVVGDIRGTTLICYERIIGDTAPSIQGG